jgi:hypothetical protein
MWRVGSSQEHAVATLTADIVRTRKGAAQAPVSAHPAFPAIVALWFAALLGLGSMILPIALLERLTVVTGIAAIFPSAAPPLAFTAKTTIAVGAAVVGALLGLLLARRVASSQAIEPAPRFGADDVRPRRPISAHDELGEDGLGSAEPRFVGNKRRSLAISEDAAPSRYLSPAPLPGHVPHRDESHSADGEALELAAFGEPDEAADVPDEQDFSMTDETNFDLSGEHGPDETERQEFVPPAAAEARLPRAFDSLPEAGEDAENVAESVDALPFAPPSLRRAPAPAPVAANAEAERAAAPIPQAYEPDESPRFTVVPSELPDASDAGLAGDERELDELGRVQLATRLGAASERRRARQSAQAAPRTAAEPFFAATGEDFAVAAAEEAALARANFFSEPRPSQPRADDFEQPAAAAAAPLDEIGFGPDDEGEDDDLAASFSLPLRKRAEAIPTGPADGGPADFSDEEDDEDVPAPDDEYSSLLAMKNPFRKADEFVRVEEPEAEEDELEATVTFPERKGDPETAPPAPARMFDPPAATATPPRNPADAERELRAALETLQRMSGAA